MTNKVILAFLLAGACGLAACGSGSNHQGEEASAAPAGVVPTSAGTSFVPKADASPLSDNALADAQWTRTACSLDTIDGSYSKDRMGLDRTRPHLFRGWMLDETKHPAGAFSVVLKGSRDYAVAAATGELRRDVGDYFKDPNLGLAGFSVSADLSKADAGDYDVEFIVQKAGKTYFCDTARKVTLN